MSFRWSFSTDKLVRRCQRQFYFREIAAHHSQKEPWRREAFVLKQLKTLELWSGSVIHEGIQHYVVPALRKGNALDWKMLTEQTIQRAKAQLAFSEQKRYREPGIAKTKHEDFCALIPHETGKGVSTAEFNGVCNEIRMAFQRLAAMSDLWQPLLGRKPTHYDAYIGLDVLDHTAAFTFLYEGGTVCAMRDQESSHKEKLSRELVAKLVYDGLKQDLPDLDEPPRSIVLRRDGRLFESEWLGFSDAIKKLVAEVLLPADILTGAVEIPKHHSYGVRSAESCLNGLKNPELGAWERLTETEGIVCTTGLPFNIPGTVEPLVVRVVRGNLNLEWVLEDTFGMSQLCWPVPTGCMRLPVDLKLCDEHLRAFAGKADEDNALFGGTLENDEEPLLTAAR